MSNELQVFSYNGQEVRTAEQNGEIWFVAKDICDILGIQNIRQNVKSLDDDEKMTVSKTYGHSGQRGGAQFMTLVNEPGMYRLIFRSKKPEAKAFTRWVTHEVLPSIRKHGMYLTDQALDAMKNDPEAFERVLKMYAESREENSALRKELDDSRPFTNLGRVVMSLSGSISMQATAQFLCEHGFETGLIRLFRRCREEKLLCSRRGRQHNMPSQKAIERGLFNLEISGGFKPTVMVTPRGLMFLTELYTRENYPLSLMMEEVTDE